MTMFRPLRLLAVLALASLAVAGCGAGDARPRTAAPATGDADVTVVVGNMVFSPATVEITAGDAVAWVWKDDTVHDVAFDDGPASPKQRSGTWQRTFDRPGRFDYVCTLHPNMRGTVVVR